MVFRVHEIRFHFPLRSFAETHYSIVIGSLWSSAVSYKIKPPSQHSLPKGGGVITYKFKTYNYEKIS